MLPEAPSGLNTAPRDLIVGRFRAVVLAVATLGFAVNFWAWALRSPSAPCAEVLYSFKSRSDIVRVSVLAMTYREFPFSVVVADVTIRLA